MRKTGGAIALFGLLFVLATGCRSEQANQPEAGPDETEGSSPAATDAPAASCSAAGLSEDEPEPAGLPAEVAMMRKEILKAAVNCDYDLLQALAFKPDDSFQYSNEEEAAGPGAQPAAFWRAQEQAGERTLAALVEILSTQPEIREATESEGPGTGSGEGYYTWPPTPDPTTYKGYRTTITSTGDWIFFLKAA